MADHHGHCRRVVVRDDGQPRRRGTRSRSAPKVDRVPHDLRPDTQCPRDEVSARPEEVIAAPPFEKRHLEAVHAVHFRRRAAGAEGMRLDVMARIRGPPGFEPPWERRTTIETEAGPIEALLPA